MKYDDNFNLKVGVYGIRGAARKYGVNGVQVSVYTCVSAVGNSLWFGVVILENKSVTPIPHQTPLSLQTSLGEPGESGILGGG